MEPNIIQYILFTVIKKKNLATFLGIVESKQWEAHPVETSGELLSLPTLQCPHLHGRYNNKSIPDGAAARGLGVSSGESLYTLPGSWLVFNE